MLEINFKKVALSTAHCPFLLKLGAYKLELRDQVWMQSLKALSWQTYNLTNCLTWL